MNENKHSTRRIGGTQKMNYSQIFKKHLELSLSKKDYFLVHDENIRYHLNRIADNLDAKTFLDAIKLQSDEKYSGYRCQSNKCFIGIPMFQMNFNNPFEEIHFTLDVRSESETSAAKRCETKGSPTGNPDIIQIVVERHLCIPLLYHYRDLLKNLCLSDALKDYSIYRFRVNDKTSKYIFPLLKDGYVYVSGTTFELHDGEHRLSFHDIFGKIKIVSTLCNDIIIQNPLKKSVSRPFGADTMHNLKYKLNFKKAILTHTITKIKTNPIMNAIKNIQRASSEQHTAASPLKGEEKDLLIVKRIFKPLQRPSIEAILPKKLTHYAILPSVFFLVVIVVNFIMLIILFVVVIRAQYKL